MGFVDLFEPFFSGSIAWVYVRVMLPGEFTVSSSNGFLVTLTLNAKCLVVVSKLDSHRA
jgi:hypothetical protein